MYGVIINNSDISIYNLILEFNEDLVTAKTAYAIDMEIRFNKELTNLLPSIMENPAEVLYILTEDWLIFNNELLIRHYQLSTAEFKITLRNYTSSITSEMITKSLKRITALISADNFKICFKLPDEIAKQLSDTSIYTNEEKQQIILPSIDEAISGIKENLQKVQDFLSLPTSENVKMKFSC